VEDEKDITSTKSGGDGKFSKGGLILAIIAVLLIALFATAVNHC
jgi:hypothetical protein